MKSVTIARQLQDNCMAVTRQLQGSRKQYDCHETVRDSGETAIVARQL